MATEQIAGLNPGTLNVIEARFGDKNGALALLQSPPEFRSFFLRLADKADLPDSAPPSATWEPFVRGWREESYYVIALTQPDHVAVRPGMIATRMIAINLEAAGQWETLEDLFEFLHTAADYVPEKTIGNTAANPSPTVSAPLLANVAHHLVHGDKPAALIGQNGFEDLVAVLWRKLPPELRRKFGFGFSFTPADLIVSHAKVVAVPASCAVRWRGYKGTCDTNWNEPLSDSIVAFLSDARARGFCEFLKAVGLVFNSFEDYGLYARLWNNWQRHEHSDEDSYALLRGLGTLLPDPHQATQQKGKAIAVATGWVMRAKADGILAQRSVKAEAFDNRGSVLGDGICEWLKSKFRSGSGIEAAGLTKIVLAVSASQSAQWANWVRNGLRSALTPLEENAAKMVWTLWTQVGSFSEIGDQLPIDQATEEAMISSFPGKISPELYQVLIPWCVSRIWITLMAECAAAHLGFRKAIELVLSQGPQSQKIRAIDLLCAAATPSEVWRTAVEHNDAALLRCGVAAAGKEPTLWTVAAGDPVRWAALFDYAIRTAPDFLQGVDIDAVVDRLLKAWDNGATISDEACGLLANLGRLEFTRYANRDRFWRLAPRRFVASALANTLRAWLKEYYSGLNTQPKLEKELVEILFDARNIEFAFPRSSPLLGPNGIVLVQLWGNERACEYWVSAIAASSLALPYDLATRAGELVTNRHWAKAARLSKDRDERASRPDLRPIWKSYYESLGRLEKLAFDLFWTSSGSSDRQKSKTISNNMINAIFVTALSEEFSAVVAHLSNRREHTEKGTIYELGEFHFDAINVNVAVVQTGMGNAPSAAATERILNLFRPDFAFFVGIAGGLKDDLRIGDVVVADKVYGYEGGRAGPKFMPRPEATPVSHESSQRAYAVIREDQWQGRIAPPPAERPTAIVKPIAAGEKLMVSEASQDLRRIRSTYTDAHAVAMEDHGFAVAVRTHPAVCFAVVRSISDLIENKHAADSSGSHGIAARNSAAFAFELLAGLVRARAMSEAVEPFID